MITYSFLQQYWWFIISLLGALLVFLLFVQGANSMVFSLGRTEDERALIMNSTGRKWEFTFTTLVTFGGAFFASFPLFYSTSFGGAYWVWMLILLSFVLQAVAYEYQSKPGNVLGRNWFRRFLVFNGIVGPLLIGAAVSTFFEGSNFTVEKGNILETLGQPVISQWTNASGGLDAVLNPWNLVLGFAIVFLARVLGLLYLVNNISDTDLRSRARRRLLTESVLFLVFFLAYVGRLLTKDGFAVDPATGIISMEPFKYFHNLITLWPLLIVLLVGVVLVLCGIGRTLFCKNYVRGIWPAGLGTVLTVLVVLLIAGWNNTSYYPSVADLQSSLTISNSSSSLFTLQAMTIVSLLVPFVLAYIIYCWRAIDKDSLTKDELANSEHKY